MCRLAHQRWRSNEIIVRDDVMKHFQVWDSVVTDALSHCCLVVTEAWDILLTWIFLNSSKYSWHLDHLSCRHVTPVNTNYLIDAWRSNRLPSSLGFRHRASLPAPLLHELWCLFNENEIFSRISPALLFCFTCGLSEATSKGTRSLAGGKYMSTQIVFAVLCHWRGGIHSLQGLASILLLKQWLCTQPIQGWGKCNTTWQEHQASTHLGRTSAK